MCDMLMIGQEALRQNTDIQMLKLGRHVLQILKASQTLRYIKEKSDSKENKLSVKGKIF